MALTHARVSEVAEHALALANESKALYFRIVEFLASNSDVAVDWNGTPKPAYINEDAAGNIDGLGFSRAQVSNAIHSLDQMRKVLANEDLASSQGDHLGNLNQLAKSDA